MKLRHAFLYIAVLMVCALPLLAQTTVPFLTSGGVVIPQMGVLPPPTIVTVNGSPGIQIDPHVSQNLAAYSDLSSGQIHYYNFSTGVNNAISNVMATGEVSTDFLSDVSSTTVVFTRFSSSGSDIMAFDTVAASLTTIDPTTAPVRESPAIGGNTVAYVDNSFVSGSGEIVAHDLVANTSTRLTNDTLSDGSPQVSPNGQVIAWQTCTGSQMRHQPGCQSRHWMDRIERYQHAGQRSQPRHRRR